MPAARGGDDVAGLGEAHRCLVNPRRDRRGIPGDAVGIAAAIPLLVVPVGNFLRCAEKLQGRSTRSGFGSARCRTQRIPGAQQMGHHRQVRRLQSGWLLRAWRAPHSFTIDNALIWIMVHLTRVGTTKSQLRTRWTGKLAGKQGGCMMTNETHNGIDTCALAEISRQARGWTPLP